MIRYLKGTIIEKIRNQIVVNVQGIGYNVYVTAATVASSNEGEEKAFYISESIREDAHDLYGFLTSNERETFELLRKVSGVGPKVALSLIGFYPADELQSIISLEDSVKLSLVPGIGKKVASKIVLELKDKTTMNKEQSLQTADPDTIDALHSLGYSAAEIAALLPKVPPTLQSSNERITWILRHLSE